MVVFVCTFSVIVFTDVVPFTYIHMLVLSQVTAAPLCLYTCHCQLQLITFVLCVPGLVSVFSRSLALSLSLTRSLSRSRSLARSLALSLTHTHSPCVRLSDLSPDCSRN